MNALWGSGIRLGKLTPELRRRAGRVLMLFTVLIAAATGVVVGVLAGTLAGAVSAVVAALVLAIMSRANLHNDE